MTPAASTALIVVALLLGQPGWRASRDAVLAFAFALALGLALAAAGHGGHVDVALLVLAAAGGLIVALGRAWPLPLLGASLPPGKVELSYVRSRRGECGAATLRFFR